MKPIKTLGTFWQEFKGFAFKGNMIDLAVAVVIGAAFSGVINSLVKDIIMPSVIYLTTAVHDVGQKAVAAAENTAAAVGVTSKPSETQPATTQAAAPSTPAAAAATPASTVGTSNTQAQRKTSPNLSNSIGRSAPSTLATSSPNC